MADVLIIGAGPAGVAAALTLRNRGKEVLVVSNDPFESGLAKAERIDNYPGLTALTGREVVKTFLDQLDAMGIERRQGRVISVMPFGEKFMASIEADVVEVGAVILATGVAKAKAYPGEEELLGRGVSYCATCDGMLYRGKDVCVVGSNAEAEKEAAFLAGIGCNVTYFSRKPAGTLGEGSAEAPAGDMGASAANNPTIKQVVAKKYEVVGDVAAGEPGAPGKVAALVADGVEYPCAAVFVLRPQIAPASLVPGLETDGGAIKVDAHMCTNVPGVFAAGDCVGGHLQVAKAVGDGQVAAFSAADFLDR